MDLVILNGRLCPPVPTFTHIGNRNSSIIDYIAVSGEQYSLVERCDVIQPGGFDSDHACVMITLNYSYNAGRVAPSRARPQYRFRVSRLRDADTSQAYKSAVHPRLLQWCCENADRQVTCCADVNSMWDTWHAALAEAAASTIGKSRDTPVPAQTGPHAQCLLCLHDTDWTHRDAFRH